MLLLKAQVMDNTDFTERGRILVYCKDLTRDYFYVTYVSPYGANFEGGFIAIPEIGTEILIQESGGTDRKWYYVGSIFEPKEGIDNQGDEFIEAQTSKVPEKEVYRARGKPQQVVLKDPSGNKLTLSNAQSPEYMNNKAELQSALGKKLVLSDSLKGMDVILLENEHGDGVKITTRADESSPARSMEFETTGPIKTISRESEVEVVVVEGREIDVINYSTGLNKDPQFPERAGNVNITSVNNDINLTVDNVVDGNIFIRSKGLKGVIQVACDGKVTIIAESDDVEIRAGKNLNLQALGNISIQAGGNIDMIAGLIASLGAGTTMNLTATAMIAADAAQVQLNSKLSKPPIPVTPITKKPNNYGE